MQLSRDVKSKVIKLRKQLGDKLKEYEGIVLELKEDEDCDE